MIVLDIDNVVQLQLSPASREIAIWREREREAGRDGRVQADGLKRCDNDEFYFFYSKC